MLWNMRDEKNFETIIMPTIEEQLPYLKDFILKSTSFQKDYINDMSIVAERLRNMVRKGPQTNFRYDSLSAYLQYHGEEKFQTARSYLYFVRKNQVHIYDIEKQIFNVVKGFRKKRKFEFTNVVAYSHTGTCFYMLPTNKTTKLACIDFDFSSTSIPLKYELELV